MPPVDVGGDPVAVPEVPVGLDTEPEPTGGLEPAEDPARLEPDVKAGTAEAPDPPEPEPEPDSLDGVPSPELDPALELEPESDELPVVLEGDPSPVAPPPAHAADAMQHDRTVAPPAKAHDVISPIRSSDAESPAALVWTRETTFLAHRTDAARRPIVDPRGEEPSDYLAEPHVQ
jgi:hypothetical protein